MANNIFTPQILPCGRTVANRLVKVALNEHLGYFGGGPPTAHHVALYATWAAHGWGMIITGNFQVDAYHLALGRDVVIPRELTEETLAPFKRLARVIHGNGDATQSESEMHPGNGSPVGARPLAVMQISHAGRQSPVFLGGRPLSIQPLAPSAVRVGSSTYGCAVQAPHGTREDDKNRSSQNVRVPLTYSALFQVPREMNLDDIRDVQQGFVRAALTAFQSGFDGVQIHCAHGYLLAQFLNTKTNLRRDTYSVFPSENALRMLHEIIEAIRSSVPSDFILGIKINSADYIPVNVNPSEVHVTAEIDRVLDHVCIIAKWGTVDFIEISGGDYESPDFVSPKHTTPRQAFFAHFSKAAMECIHRTSPSVTPQSASYTQRANLLPPLVLLTGGLRSPAHLDTALAAGHADLLGIGRGAILCPDLPTRLWTRVRVVEPRERDEIDDEARCKYGGSPETEGATRLALEHDTSPFAPELDASILAPFWLPRIGLVGASANVSWYTVRIRELAEAQLSPARDRLRRKGSTGSELRPHKMGSLEATVRMWIWIDEMQYRMVVVSMGVLITVGLVSLIL